MIYRNGNAGFAIDSESLGSLWMELVETVSKNGKFELDENRGRFALGNFRFHAERNILPDPIFEHFGNQKNIEAMKHVFFVSDIMKDFDITPSFRNGAKSYKKRMEEGKIVEFIVNRLTKIPESKKAVMVFPTYEDYEAVTNSPWNDYLPCITVLQFRIRNHITNGLHLDTTMFMRSWDIFQKGPGDLTVISMLGNTIRERLENNLKKRIKMGTLDGYVTDVHIYENTYEQAQHISFEYLHQVN